jgi:hypothetical protein
MFFSGKVTGRYPTRYRPLMKMTLMKPAGVCPKIATICNFPYSNKIHLKSIKLEKDLIVPATFYGKLSTGFNLGDKV